MLQEKGSRFPEICHMEITKVTSCGCKSMLNYEGLQYYEIGGCVQWQRQGLFHFLKKKEILKMLN